MTNARGEPVKRYTVLIFPQERERWILDSRLITWPVPSEPMDASGSEPYPRDDILAVAFECVAERDMCRIRSSWRTLASQSDGILRRRRTTTVVDLKVDAVDRFKTWGQTRSAPPVKRSGAPGMSK